METLKFQNRQIEIRRKFRRRRHSIGINVDGKIWVNVGYLTSISQIEKFLLGNLDWLEKREKKYAGIREKIPRKTFSHGEKFLFLGNWHELEFMQVDGKRLTFQKIGLKFRIGLPEGINANDSEVARQVRLVMHKYYEKSARVLLPQRVEKISAMTGLKPTALSFRSQKTRWGSCSSQGGVSLNWRLMFAPLEVIDYVVLHELCHLEHLNHSDKFWKLVEKHEPNFSTHEKWLKAHQREAEF